MQRSPPVRRRRAQAIARLAAIAVLVLVSGCVPMGRPETASSPLPLPTTEGERLLTPTGAGAVPVSGIATGTGGAQVHVSIYAPATPSSVPVILAARRIPGAEVTIYANPSQGNALFLRGDVTILVTGLAVGVEFVRNGAPVQAVNSYVAGLTYLVTYGRKLSSLRELGGEKIYLPFEGSPIEEITRFFAEREGLAWGRDIQPVYAPFASSVELLKQGKATAVALPEPYVSILEAQPEINISIDYRQRWNELTGSKDGYPQVVTLVKRDWAAEHPDIVARLNEELERAIEQVSRDPAAAAAQTQAELQVPPEVLQSALRRTQFAFLRSAPMAQAIRGYYVTIGKPLYGPERREGDESFDAFFYDAAK